MDLLFREKRMHCTLCCSIAGFEAVQRSRNACWGVGGGSPSSFAIKVNCFNTGLKLSIVDLHPEPLNPDV